MTAREIINKAAELEVTASMLQIVNSRKDLNMIADAITGEQIVNDWRDAMCHLDCIEEHQAEAIKQGQTVRII